MGRNLLPSCTKFSRSEFKMRLWALVSRPSAWSSGDLSNGPWVVAASDDGVAARLAAQVGSEGSFSLSWAPETLTYTKNSQFWIWWYQVKKATLLWGTLKEKFLPSSSILIISIKAHETMPLPYVRHSWIPELWIFWPPRGHTHFSQCQAQILLCWAFQRDLPAGYKRCEFGRSSSSSFS